MRLARFQVDGRIGWGFLEDGTLIDATTDRWPDIDAAFAMDEATLTRHKSRLSRRVPLDKLQLLAPIRCPSKLIGIGLNYHDHAIEAKLPVPDEPLVFMKFPTSITGPGQPIPIPLDSSFVDWEAELAIVVGRGGSRIPESEALDRIFGYTAANDVTARDIQVRESQWVRAKSFSGFCPLGPSITTTAELGSATGLSIQLSVNGVVKQRSSTSELIADVPRLIAFCSLIGELLPGDVILTGTPAGVGASSRPPMSLETGDEVVIEIEGIGTLRNPVVVAA